MKTYLIGISFTILALSISACDFYGKPPPLASALGDSPMLTGSIKNFATSDLSSAPIVLKAYSIVGDFEGTPIADGVVNGDGTFSIKLPGKNVMKNHASSIFHIGDCLADTMIPTTTRGAGLALRLQQEGKNVGWIDLYQPRTPSTLSQSPWVSWGNYLYVDSNSSITGQGQNPEYCAALVENTNNQDFSIDLWLSQGWHSLVIDKTGAVNKAITSELGWYFSPSALPK